ncbi:hypothetical protein TNCV_2942481 [Trichonephila clavipes]|nr:hypothetical protein TNCV_2942481 [Trichonephila clavipes]
MTAQRYDQDILQPHVLILMQRLPGAIFNKTMHGFTRQGCHKTVSALLLPFFDQLDPQICLQSSISGIIWDGPLKISCAGDASGYSGRSHGMDRRCLSRHHQHTGFV